MKKTRRRTNTRVTLADIARECNLSKATVSRVLNNRLNEFPISEATVSKVRAVAEQQGYRPNRLAKAVHSQQTNLIGLSISYIEDMKTRDPDLATYDHQSMGHTTNIILSHSEFDDYDLVIHNRKEHAKEVLHKNDFKPDLLDGIIYLNPSEPHMEFLSIASSDFPIVLIGYTEEAEKKVPCIDINNRTAAQKAVEHLIQIGRRNILALIPEKHQHLYCIHNRLQGYKDALSKNGIPVQPNFIQAVRTLPESVNQFIREFEYIDTIDAVFCPWDELAAHCVCSLQSVGKSVPLDIAVTGFNNSALSRRSVPALTSIGWSLEEQVSTAVDLLLKILRKEIPYNPGFYEVQTELFLRESTVGN